MASGDEALGACIDCTMCVQVCPTGIDIRQGAQAACIGCGLCIDACDQIMDKVGQPRGLVHPGIKCRGPEYLRIIYGPEYTEAHNLERLRQRNLGHKRALALREYALGMEALERFVESRLRPE